MNVAYRGQEPDLCSVAKQRFVASSSGALGRPRPTFQKGCKRQRRLLGHSQVTPKDDLSLHDDAPGGGITPPGSTGAYDERLLGQVEDSSRVQHRIARIQSKEVPSLLHDPAKKAVDTGVGIQLSRRLAPPGQDHGRGILCLHFAQSLVGRQRHTVTAAQRAGRKADEHNRQPSTPQRPSYHGYVVFLKAWSEHD